MREVSIHCDRCGSRTEAPHVVAFEAAPETRPGPFDLCRKCAAGLLDWLRPIDTEDVQPRSDE